MIQDIIRQLRSIPRVLILALGALVFLYLHENVKKIVAIITALEGFFVLYLAFP